MSSAFTATGILVKVKPAVATILTSSVANPTVLTTSEPHGYQTGDTLVVVAGHSGSTPAVNGTYTVTRTGARTFTVPVNVTVAGTGGTATPPAAYATVAEITRATPPGYSRNKIESTTHNDGAESYILGILRQKDAALTVNYVASEATHIAMLSYVQNNAKAQWQILLPSGVLFTGPGQVQQFQLQEATVDAIQAADIVITWNGPVIQS